MKVKTIVYMASTLALFATQICASEFGGGDAYGFSGGKTTLSQSLQELRSAVAELQQTVAPNKGEPQKSGGIGSFFGWADPDIVGKVLKWDTDADHISSVNQRDGIRNPAHTYPNLIKYYMLFYIRDYLLKEKSRDAPGAVTNISRGVNLAGQRLGQNFSTFMATLGEISNVVQQGQLRVLLSQYGLA